MFCHWCRISYSMVFTNDWELRSLSVKLKTIVSHGSRRILIVEQSCLKHNCQALIFLVSYNGGSLIICCLCWKIYDVFKKVAQRSCQIVYNHVLIFQQYRSISINGVVNSFFRLLQETVNLCNQNILANELLNSR